MLPVQIDTLKSTIGRRGGVARTNRYAIYMSHPNKKQGLLNTDISGIASNLLTTGLSGGSFDPWVFFNDPRDIFLLCDSVQLPGKRISTMEKHTNHKGIKKPYSYMVDEVTFSFILTNDYYIKKYFDEWQEMIVSSQDKMVSYKSAYTTDIILQQISTGNDYIPAYGVKLKNAFPIAVNAIELSNQQENEIVRCTITVAFDDFEPQSLKDSLYSLFDLGKNLVTGTLGQLSSAGSFLRNLF